MRRRPNDCAVESLEHRQLFSAGIVDGTLEVVGTERKDTVVVSLDAADPTTLEVRVNRESFTFALDDVNHVFVDLLGGNDKLTVKETAGPIYLSFQVDGGDGNDAVITGSGNDVLDGGAGNDKLTGGSGDDLLLGDEGNDRLLGGDDNDQLDAGDGKDKLDGAGGDDNLDGGDGKDAVKTGDGANRVAIDETNAAEVRGHAAGAEITNYEVTPVEELPAALTQLLSEVGDFIIGFQPVRAEAENGNYSVYYHFGTDPALHKVVLSVAGDEVELVTRQISLQEARDVAMAAFVADHPDAVSLVSLFQHPHTEYDVRYRTADGAIQSVTTTEILWGVDDLESDLDNDGRSDNQHGEGGND